MSMADPGDELAYLLSGEGLSTLEEDYEGRSSPSAQSNCKRLQDRLCEVCQWHLAVGSQPCIRPADAGGMVRVEDSPNAHGP